MFQGLLPSAFPSSQSVIHDLHKLKPFFLWVQLQIYTNIYLRALLVYISLSSRVQWNDIVLAADSKLIRGSCHLHSIGSKHQNKVRLWCNDLHPHIQSSSSLWVQSKGCHRLSLWSLANNRHRLRYLYPDKLLLLPRLGRRWALPFPCQQIWHTCQLLRRFAISFCVENVWSKNCIYSLYICLPPHESWSIGN